MSPPTPSKAAIAAQLIAGYLTRKRGTVLDGEQIGDITAIIDRHAASAWQGMESAPKDRLVHLWIAATPRGERWSAEDHMLPYCYYDDICSEWRSSRPQGRLVCVPERFVTHWRDEEKPAAPTPTQP